MKYNRGWIGVDLDGTLAEYTTWKGPDIIGEPIMPMVDKIKSIINTGITVKVFTARVASCVSEEERLIAKKAIANWTKLHLGTALEATSEKDWNMIEYYDDRAIQVEYNTGKILGQDH